MQTSGVNITSITLDEAGRFKSPCCRQGSDRRELRRNGAPGVRTGNPIDALQLFLRSTRVPAPFPPAPVRRPDSIGEPPLTELSPSGDEITYRRGGQGVEDQRKVCILQRPGGKLPLLHGETNVCFTHASQDAQPSTLEQLPRKKSLHTEVSFSAVGKQTDDEFVLVLRSAGQLQSGMGIGS